MSGSSGLHVVYRGKSKGAWAVIRTGAVRALKLFPTKRVAAEWAMRKALDDRCTVYVHGADGMIDRRIQPFEDSRQ